MPPRLLIVSFTVCPAPDRHGVGLLNAIKALASRHSVDALTLRPSPNVPGAELPFVEKFMKTRMLRVPVGHGTLGEKVEAFGRAIRRQLEGEEYDVIHLRSAWGGAAIVAGLQSAKFVYEVARSIEGEPRAADEQLAALLGEEEQLCLSRADMVLVPTARGRRHLLDRGVDPHQAFVVPPGVDVDHFDWEEESGGADRVLYAGQIAGGRGVRLLAAAIGQVRRSRPVKLVLAGAVEDSFRAAFEESLADAGLVEDDVELLGAIDHDDMPRVIAQATVCVAPATPDDVSRPLAGFPTKLLEYMACRRAVVAPRRSSVQEVIEDGQDGLLFEPGDADELAAAILKLLEDEPLRAALAESGYRRVRQEFPASATRRRLLEAYGGLLPPSKWLPPSRGASSIDALPSSPDTTSRRASPFAREWAEISGVIEVPQTLLETEPIAVDVTEAVEIVDSTVSTPATAEIEENAPREVVIEALDFEEAGEARDATIEPFGADATPAPELSSEALVEIHTQPHARVPEAFSDEMPTRPAALTEPASAAAAPELADDDGERTIPGPLRTRHPSG